MIRNIIYIVSAIVVAAVMGGCSSGTREADVPQPAGPTITVVAEIAQQLHSRAEDDDDDNTGGTGGTEGGYQESGPVTSGIYCLTYLTPVADKYGLADVDFNKNGSTPGLGMVSKRVDNTELKWDDVSNNSTVYFYLDNVDPEIAGTGSTETTIVLPEGDENPYKAALFDNVGGTNDLLWGSKEVQRNTKYISFDLHHCMSRLRVQVTVDKTYEVTEGELSLEGATVEITSINQNPISYDRLSGTLALNELAEDEQYNDKIYQTLTLVEDKTKTEPEYPLNWNDIIKDTEHQEEVYVSKDFVLPPQGLLEDTNRPHLRITLSDGKDGKDGKVYEGILPHAMVIDTGSSTDNYPVALYFLREHILTIRTIISNNPPQLGFMPVYVVKWVDKGKFDIDAHQSGIYTAAEFYKLIDYYIEGDTENATGNEYQLGRYGSIDDDGKWKFSVFHSVTLDYDTIAGKMQRSGERKDFTFEFNNYDVFVQKRDSEGNAVGAPVQVSPDELKQILTGDMTL